MLVRKELKPVFIEVQLESDMNRSLLLAELHPDRPEASWKRGGAVATAHFESLNTADTRRTQLRACNGELGASSPYSNAVLVGDFNFDDTQQWGDWRRAYTSSTETAATVIPRKRPSNELENCVLRQVLPDFEDQWPLLRPGERGATFDGPSNPVCVRDPLEVMRYDRVLLRGPTLPSFFGRVLESGRRFLGGEPSPGLGGARPPAWEGARIELVGVGAINTDGLKPSDHYGLEFALGPRPAQ
mmetsp:Transcript_30872/g.69356  ORF Transcript_30872/g.69356 Transcript_30872/m.69356 type:complete len:243 (+) Transcript_30872:494-1222(+)